jgi:hypothetical protein
MSLQLITPVSLAAVEGGAEIPGFPLSYQIACAILTALFLWTFSIARDPRGWRRLYQARFTKKEEFSVNRNKKIDENIKKYGISVAMVFLVGSVTLFVLGVTYRNRHNQTVDTRESTFMKEDASRILEGAPKSAARRATGGKAGN